jgi:hypothetical protein
MCSHDELYLMTEVETKDSCTVRYSSTSNNAFYFVALKFAGLLRPSYLDKLWSTAEMLKRRAAR